MAALAYEILLMRLFSIIQWHHFAYMIISLALLGYGASGTFVSLLQRRLLAHFRSAYAINIALFGICAIGCYLAAQQIRFNAEEVLWDAGQPLRLMAIYLLLALPFFFAANAIALALAHFRDRISHLYAADLAGAGAGSLGIVGLLYGVFPTKALCLLGALGLTAAAVAWWEVGGRPRIEGLAFLVVAVMALGLPPEWTALNLSPYKGLENALRVQGAHLLDERSGPLGLLSVVESPAVPLRHAPGLSLIADTVPPEQLGVFTDGGNMTAIARDTGDRAELAYLDQLTSALPYHLASPRRVLVLGAGGGAEVLQARYHGAQEIHAVELNPQMIALVREAYGEYSGNLYGRDDVTVHLAEARGFATASDRQFELVQLALLDAFGAASAGLYALSESYLYTVEGLQAYLRRLAPGGYLAITRWIQVPPRDNLKLFATAVQALEREGVREPGRRMALIRGWQTGTLVIKNGALTESETAALRAFCARRAFDPAWYPGMAPEEANRHNVLREPYLYQGARALLGPDRDRYLDRYKFHIAPATDERPYFYHFLKWSVLPEILELRGRGGTSLIEWGYLVLVATLAQALIASLVLILLPLAGLRRVAHPAAVGRGRVATYFFAVGLGFLFIEIAFIQKFTLFLHHPLYAAAAVLTAFLLFAGVGSQVAAVLVRRGALRRGVYGAVAGIVLVAGAYTLALTPLFAGLGHLGIAAKVALAVALIAPLAFCMGMPFPLALASLGQHAPGLIPWAWGVNGCASVVSAVGATLLAIHLGFTAVVVSALVLYILVALAFPQPAARSAGPRLAHPL